MFVQKGRRQPSMVSSKDLWKLCDRQGVVADVYIARKLSKSGRRFGFVRFIKNPDQANLLEDLNKIWIGSHHMFASIARFDRKQNSQPNQSHQKQSNNTKPHETGHASHTMGGRSYASVLNGKEGTQKPVLAGPITKNITLENSDLLELSDTSSVVLAKVRDVHLIINIYRVLKKEGFSDFKCKYMGGLWLWIEFSSDESRLKFQKNTEMELYFTQRKLVSHNFIPDERMIWIEIDGLPLNAWTTNAFKKIAGNWGETVFVDEDADENIANGRVCIKTKIKTHIMDSCLVSIKGVRYQVRVREFANWVPDFASLDNISQHDYESEASGNDQDIHSINESQEEGEINDKKEQMGYEMNAPGKSVDSFEEGEIIGESDDGCVKDCMGKKLDDDVEKDIEDCSNNVTEKCGVVNNNMSNNVEGEILEDHFDGDRGNDTIEDNADVNPSTNVSLEVNIPEVANDSSIVSPSTPPGNDLNIAKESCSTWLDYVGPLITDELDSEKRWSYRDPKGNIQGSFSLAQLHMWKDYFPSDLQIWSYYGNVKETILLHNALKRRTKNADQYVVSIKEGKKDRRFVSVPALTKDHKGVSPIRRIQRDSIRRIQDIVLWKYARSIKRAVHTPRKSPIRQYSEEEEAEAMTETMKQYMSKTRNDYGSGVARPKIDNKDQFELKGQFLKELRENTFSGSDNEDANEHIEQVLKIVDLFHVPNITVDQLML
ncbi:RNA-directed DNA polymerase, eukaryota [Tanacetum coccineum]